MLDWRIIFTVFITLGILIVILSSSPQMNAFLDDLQDRVYGLFPEKQEDRNVSFVLTAEIGRLIASPKDVNIEIAADNFTAQLRDIRLSGRSAKVSGFSGSMLVENSTVTLDGAFKKLELSDSTIDVPQGAIKLKSVFSSLAIDNLVMREIAVPRGKIGINDAVTDSENRIIISSLAGRFVFDSELRISGRAQKISIPDSKIFIG